MASTLALIYFLTFRLEAVLYWGVGIAGIVGLIMVAMTRPDAFPAADRQGKGTWLALMAGASVACLIGVSFPMLAIAGVVIVGLYWWDLRPQLRDLLGGAQGGW